MKVLVLGGTSFFGKLFVEQAAAAGHDVTVFSRRCPGASLPGAVVQVRGDRRSEEDLKMLAGRDWDYVIDNICFGANEAEIAARLFSGRVGRWIYTSSVSVYHAFEKTAVFTEEWPGSAASGPLKPEKTFPYGVGKWRAEEVFRKEHARRGFPVVMLRFPMIVGRNDPQNRAQSYLHRIADKAPLILPGGGLHLWRFIYFRDAARSLIFAAETDGVLGQVFNIADSEPITIRDWVLTAFDAMGVAPQVVDIPIHWLDENGFDYAGTPFASEEDFSPEVGKAEEELGWFSTPIDEWIRECMNEFKKDQPSPPGNYRKRARELELVRSFSP